MAILDDVKLALRETTAEFDGEIQDLIDSCKIDLTESGATNTDDTDALVKRAIITYAKAHYGYGNPHMKDYKEEYKDIKILMGLSSEYNGGA